jgi:hypothetical protein
MVSLAPLPRRECVGFVPTLCGSSYHSVPPAQADPAFFPGSCGPCHSVSFRSLPRVGSSILSLAIPSTVSFQRINSSRLGVVHLREFRGMKGRKDEPN